MILLYCGATEDRVPTRLSCPSFRKRRSMRAAFARAQKLLDAGERAGLDLWALEVRRRRMEEDMAAYDAHVHASGDETLRARKLRKSIGASVDVLAAAFRKMLDLVEQPRNPRRRN